MERKLTDGEVSMIASALFERRDRLVEEADQILQSSKFWPEYSDANEGALQKLEALAGTIRVRYKGLRATARGCNTLANFLIRYGATVDCIITIPDQF